MAQGDQGSNVFVGDLPPAGPGGTSTVKLISEPRRSNIGYLLDPLGDNTGGEDVGLTTYGWEFKNGGPTDNFILTTRFRGAGDYLFSGHVGAPSPMDISVRVHCVVTGCTLTLVEPRTLTGILVTLAITIPDKVEGSFTITIPLPGVAALDFNMFGGRPPRSDSAPNSGLVHAVKGGTGNTWVVPD